RVVLDGAVRPPDLEHLVGGASEEDPAAGCGERNDSLSHPPIIPVLGGPRRRVDHPVEANELVHVDGSHGASSWIRWPASVADRFSSSTRMADAPVDRGREGI